jgi:hypothetical protein
MPKFNISSNLTGQKLNFSISAFAFTFRKNFLLTDFRQRKISFSQNQGVYFNMKSHREEEDVILSLKLVSSIYSS